jgi:carbon-monoxide dehydrogenase medium subunit
MFAAPFDYYRAASLGEAQRLLQQHPGAKLLAGGHSLIPLLKLRLATPAALIDIGRIADLKGIAVRDGSIRIGALTTHAELAASEALKTSCPILAEAAAQIGDQQVRNCGTIGGNVAHADPASDLPTVLSALDAQFVAAGPQGERTIPASEFFMGMMATALGERDILTGIDVPARRPGEGMAYAKFTHPASRYAVVGAAVTVTMSNGVCSAARVAIGGAVPTAMRATSVERALAGARPLPEIIDGAARHVRDVMKADVLEDIYASAEYRKAMTVVFVKRAITAAVARAA